MKDFQPLSINPECFSKDRVINEVRLEFRPNTVQTWKKWTSGTDLFSKEFTDILDELSCSVFFAELFYTPPFRSEEHTSELQSH